MAEKDPWSVYYARGRPGSEWILVVKDEYSGKLFGYTLVVKTLALVMQVLRRFEAWTARKYGLHVAIIRHDNDTSVVAFQFNAETEYQRWAADSGIEIELPPTYTHQPNGGAERAGREVIE